MDPGTALAVAGLASDAVRCLYDYYCAWKNCDEDVAELRAHLLWLQSAFQTAKRLLTRSGISSHDRSLVESALVGCQQAAEELKEVLAKIKSKDGQPQTALQKLKAHGRKAIYPFKKSTIQSLAENVETCQTSLQLAVHLLGLDTVASSFERLQIMDDRLVNGLASLEGGLQQFRLDQQSNDAKIISEIQNTASKTQSAVESGRQETLRTKEALVQHHTNLEGILKTNEDREKAKIIINSLSTGELRRRRQDVRDAHSETFNWILETEDSTLASWLRNGTGLFWIRGKAGSGKSTLMKFIVEDDRTEELLQTWAASGQVCIAQHFFWIAGTSLQKSHQGMLQDLLYQILNSDHSLVPVVCRKRWQSKNVVAQDWTTKELSNVLRAAVDQTHQHLCLFLDGLDEYFPDVEHDVLMSFLQKLASRSNVKILVSSRPWRVFESAFGHSPNRLHLEDVTQKDIFKYTRSRLISAFDHGPKSFLDLSSMRDCTFTGEPTDGDTRMVDLVDLIVEKAVGVFLWVSLVVDALCDRLRAGQALKDLQRHVHELPADLEDYLREMILMRISKTWRSEMAMALQIKVAADDSRCGYEPECFWVLAEHGARSFEEELNSNVGISTSKDFTDADMSFRIRGLVRECCRDLLTVWAPDERFPEGRIRVDYTHRTVYDFLIQDETQRTLALYSPRVFEDKFLHSKLILLQSRLKSERTTVHSGVAVRRMMFSLLPYFRGRWLRPEEYFDSMPGPLIEQHCQRLIGDFDRSPTQLFERVNLIRVAKAGMILLWLLKRRGFETAAQRMLDKVSAKWPSILQHPFWFVDSQAPENGVKIGKIDFMRGTEILQELLEIGLNGLFRSGPLDDVDVVDIHMQTSYNRRNTYKEGIYSSIIRSYACSVC